MANIIFDYNALEDAKSNAKKIVTAWNGLDDYKSALNTKLKLSLDERILSKSEPYGHTYISNARTDIDVKVAELETTRKMWIDLSTTISNFLQYVKEQDNKVVSIFQTTSSAYTDYSGIGGFFRYIGDGLYNFFAVDLANCNGFTRAISDWCKERADDLAHVIQQVDDWFRHGNGRYILNIVGSVALTAVAIAGVAISIIGLPFTGGASCTLAVGCISVIGVAAGITSAAITAFNSAHAINANLEALENADDPGRARFHGDITGYSDYVRKTDLGSKKANEEAARRAQNLDTAKAFADVVQVGTGLATTFGTKSVELLDDAGRVTKYTSFDFSPSNVKANVLKTFGFKATKEKVTVDVAEVKHSTIISNADEIGDTTIDITKASSDMEYKSATFEKKVTVNEKGKKTVTRTARYNKANASTEYKSIVASNNVLTQEYSTYVVHAEASSTVIDYTNATSSAKSVAAAKAANDSLFKKGLTAVKNTGSNVATVTTFLKASEEDRLESTVHNIVKKNYFVNQVDKYIIKYDTAKDKAYLFGDTGKKLDSLGKQVWKNITEPAS